MIVVVEGIDRVGKTTFCDRLNEATGWPIYKHDNETFDYADMDDVNEVDKMLQILDVIDQLDDQFGDDRGIVFDRFHLSNLVYGWEERDYNIVDSLTRCKAIEQRLLGMKQNVVLVMLYDDNGPYRASIEHGKDLSDYQQMFDFLYDSSELPKIKGTICDVDLMANAVMSASQNLE